MFHLPVGCVVLPLTAEEPRKKRLEARTINPGQKSLPLGEL
jgi:hypothetical protein